LQLSSPVEEATLSKVYNAEAEDTTESVVTFTSVETNQATLTITASDLDIPLGTSKTYEVASFCSFDATNVQSEYKQTITVDILPSEDPKATEAVCSIELEVSYTPSKKDQREQLYELLAQISQRRSAAMDKMREAAMAARRQEMASSGSGSASMERPVVKKDPAVKPGFLNKKAPKKKESSAIQAWYERNLGPNSLLRQVFPIAKNYIIFVGACVFFHFKGQLLALPPPV
jgi:hypothetical protein